MARAGRKVSGGIRRIAPKVSSRPVAIEDDGAVHARERLEHCGVELAECCGPAPGGAGRACSPCVGARRPSNSISWSGATRFVLVIFDFVDSISRRDKPREAGVRVAEDDDERPAVRFSQIEGGLEDAVGQVGRVGGADGLAPRRGLGWDIEERQRASLNANAMLPPAKTLISCQGVSTSAICWPESVARAWASYGLGQTAIVDLDFFGLLRPSFDIDHARQDAVAGRRGRASCSPSQMR